MDNFLENIFTSVKKKHIIVRTIMIIVSLFISSLAYNLFLLPTNLVAGGANGISIIIKHVYKIDPSITIFIVLVICNILSFIFLGKERTIGTLFATILYPIFVEITSIFTNKITIDTTDLFLVVIFTGILTGIASGLMYKTGYSNGGLPVISQILYKYYKIPIAKSNLVLNSIVVIIGGIYFGWTMVMYAIILLYINSIIIDKVLLGISNNKAFYIITKEDKKVKDYIINIMHHSVTTFDVKGAFLKKKRRVLLTVIPSREYYRVTEGIKLIDKEVFFLATDAYQVEGGK